MGLDSAIDAEILAKHGIPDKQRFTVPEMSTYLGIPVKTVYSWHYTGKYNGIKIGGARFFEREVIISILTDSTSV